MIPGDDLIIDVFPLKCAFPGLDKVFFCHGFPHCCVFVHPIKVLPTCQFCHVFFNSFIPNTVSSQ